MSEYWFQFTWKIGSSKETSARCFQAGDIILFISCNQNDRKSVQCIVPGDPSRWLKMYYCELDNCRWNYKRLRHAGGLFNYWAHRVSHSVRLDHWCVVWYLCVCHIIYLLGKPIHTLTQWGKLCMIQKYMDLLTSLTSLKPSQFRPTSLTRMLENAYRKNGVILQLVMSNCIAIHILVYCCMYSTSHPNGGLYSYLWPSIVACTRACTLWFVLVLVPLAP